MRPVSESPATSTISSWTIVGLGVQGASAGADVGEGVSGGMVASLGDA
jgi:hypothetical protein